jgi:hypothetical protein
MSALCAVAGAGFFSPHYVDRAALLSERRESAALQASGALLDKHSRRRASDLTKACADVYQQALDQAGFDALHVGAVFGSALGEASTTIGLLDQLWRGTGALSPMRFAASVHNAAAGVVSIGTHNTGFTTALGADHDTPAMTLLEGMALALAHDAPVIVVCADEAAPADLVHGDEGWEFLACALALAPAASAPRAWLRITAPQRGLAVSPPSAALPRRLTQNPVIGLLDLILAIDAGAPCEVRLDRGLGRGFGARIARDP